MKKLKYLLNFGWFCLILWIFNIVRFLSKNENLNFLNQKFNVWLLAFIIIFVVCFYLKNRN